LYDFDLPLHIAHQERGSEVKRLKSADPAAREIDLLSKISLSTCPTTNLEADLDA